MDQATSFWFLSWVLLFVGPLQASEADGQPAPGVLVLRNGEVLVGTTTKVGDRYVVAKSDGTELRIPTREVEMHCLDLDEAYIRRRQTISQRDASGHLQLADWCLRCGLHARAADELLAVIALAPRDPRIRNLERRLESATDPKMARGTAPVANPSPVRRDDFDRVLSGLPDDAIENFASRVQPLLLNRCGSSACHGERSASEFRLASPGRGKTTTLRYTQRNLVAALRQVDSAKPEGSPLLTAPGRPHGGLKSAVFGERDREQLQLLDAWVRKANRAVPPSQPVSVVSPPGQLFQSGLHQPIPLPNTTDDADGVPGPSVRGIGNATSAALDFRDPFDPERFNRQFLTPPAPQETSPPANAPGTPGYSTATEAAPAVLQR